MFRYFAGVAAVALAAAPFAAPLSAQGNGNGNNKGKGGPPAAAKADRGGPGKAQSKQAGRANKPDRGPPAKAAANKLDRGGPAIRANGNGNGNGKANAKRAGGPAHYERGPDKRRGDYAGYDRRGDDGYFGGYLRDAFRGTGGLIDGCPPGLAKKRNGCLPPGQAKKRYASYRPDYFGYRGYDRGDYYYRDGYLLRYGSGGLLGYIPLLGGALGLGDVWPSYYRAEPLPRYYSDYYSLGGPNSYRYADNVIYRVDPETAAIASVAAILTGDDFTVGQPMPMGYDVYNVPYRYRDRYYDTPEYNYRYADGYVYRVDPETALITAAIDLLI